MSGRLELRNIAEICYGQGGQSVLFSVGVVRWLVYKGGGVR